MKIYSIPPHLETWIESQLVSLGSSLKNSKELAHSIKRMADYYAENPEGQTPWAEKWCQLSQLAYYFPLNYLRNARVFGELNKLSFFNENSKWFEYGSGLGPSLEAFQQLNSRNISNLKVQTIERMNFPRDLMNQRFRDLYKIPILTSTNAPKSLDPNTLLVMSYSLTELDSLADWMWTAHSVVILEPSTRDDGRKLMQLRSAATKKGYHIFAPCTHAQDCPLLAQSPRDWCHDRLHIERPSWLINIEEHLPFKNATLTVSYLAFSKDLPPKKLEGKARVVGDFLDEKGKSRQLICRNDQREFLAFLKKNHDPKVFYRGDVLELQEPIEKKGDELRLSPENISYIKD